MRIAINTRFLLRSKMEGFGWYTYEISKRLVETHPEHTFYFFFDRPYDEQFVFAKNVVPIVLNPPARHPILFWFWFEFAVTKALKKYKIDVFFSPDGYLSLRSKIPQVATIHDINFEHYPKDLPFSARSYLRYFFPKFARKATKLITVSNFSKKDICSHYHVSESKIKVTWNAASPIFKPLIHAEKEHVKSYYTKGKNYFIFVGSLHKRKNVQRLLDAYSSYLNTCKNPFELVIVGEKLWKKDASIQLNTEIEPHVHFTGHVSLEELSRVLGAASCLVFVPYFEGFGIPLVEAMNCAVPIIAGNLTSLPEVVGDAGLLVDPFSVDEIAQAMQHITEDEELRTDLAAKALTRSQLFSWDKAAAEVWEELERVGK
jgi:glycosyltransferase involved in cell wall biosynthesis